jgi:hypothetical protein
VASVRFGGERLGAVDADGMHDVAPSDKPGTGAYTAMHSVFNRVGRVG